MGSSPVTATILADSMDLLDHLETIFRERAPLAAGEGLVVAFSGGPDSTALLLGASRLARRRGFRLAAAHLDHGLDAGSAGRAEAAARVAARLTVPLVRERREVAGLRRPGESPEEAARRVRYELLEEVRRGLGARWVATAHHRDDQAETVLLRLLFGSGLEGLAGIRDIQGAVVRPLLRVPRAALRAAVEAAGLPAVDDPTNLDLGVPRNRVRHLLLPALAEPHLLSEPRPPGPPLPSPPHRPGEGGKKTEEEESAGLSLALARLADRARGASGAIERRLGQLLAIEPLEDGVAVDLRTLERLPRELLPFALAALHRRAGAPYPAGSAARTELLRQLRLAGPRPACDCGDGWRWASDGERLTLRREEPEEISDFSYTLEIPGELHIPELDVRVGLHHRPVEPWMFQGAPHRAGLALPLAPGDRVTVRNRRPGDRLHPLGARGSRRLKEVFIDRRVPRRQRDRLPLVCVDDRIAWVPGVTIDQRFRIAGQATAWVATLGRSSTLEATETR